MKLTLRVDFTDGAQATVVTNLWVITQWERKYKSKITQMALGNRKPYPRGTQRRRLAELLVATGWWPPAIDFDTNDLATVVKVLNESRKQ